MCNLCSSLSHINWWCYIASVVVVFAIGGVWYSRKVFGNKWIEVFNIQMPPAGEKVKPAMFLPLVFQIIASAFLGIVLFVLTAMTSAWMSLLVLAAFCGWQKMTLKFKIINFKQYFIAAAIEVGYMFIAGVVFILFATL